MTTNVIILNQGPKPVTVNVVAVNASGEDVITEEVHVPAHTFSRSIALYQTQHVKVVERDVELS